jgi:hypothetical protein
MVKECSMTTPAPDPRAKPLTSTELEEEADANRIEPDAHKLRDTHLPASESELLRDEEHLERPTLPNIARLPPD